MTGFNWLAAIGLLLVNRRCAAVCCARCVAGRLSQDAGIARRPAAFYRRCPGQTNTHFASALLQESDGCKARRAGKGRPLLSGATQQTRFLAATRRDGGDSGAFLCRELLAVNDTAAHLASRTASRIAVVAGVKCVLVCPDVGWRFAVTDVQLI